jgi:hypothetical protein
VTGAGLLSQVITDREGASLHRDRAQPAPDERGTVFPGPRLVAAIAGRVTFSAHILQAGTQSWRLAADKTASRARRPGHNDERGA